MYKIVKKVKPIGNPISVQDLISDAFIPFDPANTDYANFKRDIEEGAELQDADGNVMSPEAAKAFVATLP